MEDLWCVRVNLYNLEPSMGWDHVFRFVPTETAHIVMRRTAGTKVVFTGKGGERSGVGRLERFKSMVSIMCSSTPYLRVLGEQVLVGGCKKDRAKDGPPSCFCCSALA